MTRSTASAFILRETAAVSANRVAYVVPVLLLIVGVLPVARASGDAATTLLLLQALLYLVPLFAITAGTSSAHNEHAEGPLIASLPISPYARVLGKFAVLSGVFVAATFALVLPSLIAGGPAAELLRLWGYAAGVAAVFLALGLCAGFRIEDGVRAHVVTLLAWLAATFGFGLLAWALAGGAWAAGTPDLWAAILMISPLETMRVAILFSVENVPFELQGMPPLTRFWLNHTAWLFAGVSALWTAVALAIARPKREG